MRKIIFLLGLFISIQTSASHLLGGEITWECDGNNNYIFTLHLYRDCNGAPLASGNKILESNSPAGNINVAFVTKKDITISCANSSQLVNCAAVVGGVSYAAVMEKYTYRSAPINITGTPPPNGYRFSYSACCRSASIINLTGQASYYIESIMYQNSAGGCMRNSAQFLYEAEPYIKNANEVTFLASSGNPNDSIFYRLVAPKQDSLTAVPFSTGFSATSPLPDASENMANGPNVFDGQRGILSYDIQSATSGNYAYVVIAEVWNNGVLISSVMRDLVIGYVNNLSANNNPYSTIDTALHFNLTRVNNYAYELITVPGDTVQLEIVANDFDFQPSGTPQNITFEAFGAALDSNWNTNNPLFASEATTSPVAPQVGYTQALQNKVNFSWGITTAMANTDNPNYQFLFSFRDDACHYPGVDFITLNVQVKTAASVSQDTVYVCHGDSIQLSGTTASGNYLWTPNSNISNNTIANPWVSPTSSGYYYLSDPQFPGQSDGVYVSVENAGTFTLTNQGGILSLGGTANITLKQWYYNGIPFYNPFDTLIPFGAGDYWVNALGTACLYNSDTVTIPAGGNLVSIDPANGLATFSPQPLTVGLGFNFQVNNSGAGDLKTIYLIGINTGKPKKQANDFTVKLYEAATQTELFSDTRILNNPNGAIIEVPTQLNLKANTRYTLVVSGDSAIFINTYQNVTYPFNPFNSDLEVIGATTGPVLQYPSNPSNDLIAVAFAIDNGVGLEEEISSSLKLYPNPAKESIVLSGIDLENAVVKVSDISGKLLNVLFTEEGENLRADIKDLPLGVYMIKLTVRDTLYTRKFIKK